jgi:hypothetical protein
LAARLIGMPHKVGFRMRKTRSNSAGSITESLSPHSGHPLIKDQNLNLRTSQMAGENSREYLSKFLQKKTVCHFHCIRNKSWNGVPKPIIGFWMLLMTQSFLWECTRGSWFILEVDRPGGRMRTIWGMCSKCIDCLEINQDITRQIAPLLYTI